MTWKESTDRTKGELAVLTVGFYSLGGTKDLLKGFWLLILIYEPCYYPPVLLGFVMTGIIKSHASKHTDSWWEMAMTFVPSCHIISLFFLLLFKALNVGPLWSKEAMSRSSPVAPQAEDESLAVYPCEEGSSDALTHMYSFSSRTTLERKDATALLVFIPHQWVGWGKVWRWKDGWAGENRKCAVLGKGWAYVCPPKQLYNQTKWKGKVLILPTLPKLYYRKYQTLVGM